MHTKASSTRHHRSIAVAVLVLSYSLVPSAFAQVPAPRVSGLLILRETYARDAALTATVHRARLQADGTLPQRLSYRLLVEYSASAGPRAASVVSLRDAYARWTRAAWSIQFGQYKTPFAREYVVPLTALETAELATVVDSLAPKRDIGVMGEWTAPYASASLGVFNGEGPNASANRDSSMLVVSRVTVRPIAPS